jgi:hypothetical protein
MFNKLVAISLFLCTVWATDLQAQSIDSVGVMTRDVSTPGPKTGLSFTFPAPSGFLSVTTDESPRNVVFTANASVSCMTLLDKVSSGPNDIIRLVVGGTTTGSGLAENVPGVLGGDVSLANNEYVGLVELTVSRRTGEVVQTRRGNFPSEFEACSGAVPPNLLPSGFPRGDNAFCSGQDFSTIPYVSCADVVGPNRDAWVGGPLAPDRTLTTGDTLFKE